MTSDIYWFFLEFLLKVLRFAEGWRDRVPFKNCDNSTLIKAETLVGLF